MSSRRIYAIKTCRKISAGIILYKKKALMLLIATVSCVRHFHDKIPSKRCQRVPIP